MFEQKKLKTIAQALLTALFSYRGL